MSTYKTFVKRNGIKKYKELTLFFPDPWAGYSAEGFLALSFDPSLVSLIIRAAANAMIYNIFFLVWFFWTNHKI